MTKRKRPENPENLSDEELLEKVEKDNDERSNALIVKAHGMYMPTAVKHDMNRMRIYLEHLLAERGILAAAALDYECWRSELISENEAQVARAELLGGLPRPGPMQGGPMRIVRPGDAERG